MVRDARSEKDNDEGDSENRAWASARGCMSVGATIRQLSDGLYSAVNPLESVAPAEKTINGMSKSCGHGRGERVI